MLTLSTCESDACIWSNVSHGQEWLDLNGIPKAALKLLHMVSILMA